MVICNIDHIPHRLHQGARAVVNEFFPDEKLYWRLGPHNIVAPYSAISLYDVSVNRSGEDDSISLEDDVLWTLDANATFTKYNSEVVAIAIVRIFPETIPTRTFNYPEDKTPPESVEVKMTLIHDPLPCNYAHCMFVFDLEEGRVTKENYESGFSQKKYKHLRKICKDVLNKAIIQKQIVI